MFLYSWVERRALTPQAWRPWLWLWLGLDATGITHTKQTLLSYSATLQQIGEYTQSKHYFPILQQTSLEFQNKLAYIKDAYRRQKGKIKARK